MDIAFDDLPLQRPGPLLNAWGQFGVNDELGRLNLITPEVVKDGVSEVKHGIVVNLKYVRYSSTKLMAVYLWMLFRSLAIAILFITICTCREVQA